VILPHRQLFWNAVNTVWATDLGPDDRVLACLPLFHTGGLNCLATPTLYRGGTVLLMEAFDAGLALQVAESQRATMLVAVPTMYQMLLDAGLDRYDLSALKTILCGGAPCPEPLFDAWLDRGFNFRQGFGMTEVGPNCFSLPAWMTRRKRGSVGQVVLHGDARIVDELGQPVGPGEVGELCLSGPHVCAGYWNDAEATSAVLRDGWFHTGDLARADDDGFFYVAGRKKDMFISGGENVYPAEIENALLGHPGVAEVAVVGVPDPRWGEVGLAVIVGRAGLELEALQAHCHAHLARFKVPKRFELVDALPRNASGKVLKAAVRARFVE
jgi:fatty-acyl-CoA synthase